MKIVNAGFEIVQAPDHPEEMVERIGRTCYKSEDKIGPGTAEAFVRMLRDRKHLAMFDHVSASVKFTVDRGVSHELVRHRIAAYAQESTRYCNYSKGKFDGECTFVRPHFFERNTRKEEFWRHAMRSAEDAYLVLLEEGATAQEARSVLPNSLKTEIVATLDFSAWRHVFRLRTAKEAHPQMREVMVPCLSEFVRRWPAFFDDLV